MSNTIVTTADPLLEQAAERFAEILIAQWEEDHKQRVPPQGEPNENPMSPRPSLAHVSEAR
jgi:hypothetical protein